MVFKTQEHTAKKKFAFALLEIFHRYEDVQFARSSVALMKKLNRKVGFAVDQNKRQLYIKWFREPAINNSVRLLFQQNIVLPMCEPSEINLHDTINDEKVTSVSMKSKSIMILPIVKKNNEPCEYDSMVSLSPINIISSPNTISPIEKNEEACENSLSIGSILKSLEEFLVKKPRKTENFENQSPNSTKTSLPFQLNTPKQKPDIIVKRKVFGLPNSQGTIEGTDILPFDWESMSLAEDKLIDEFIMNAFDSPNFKSTDISITEIPIMEKFDCPTTSSYKSPQLKKLPLRAANQTQKIDNWVLLSEKLKISHDEKGSLIESSTNTFTTIYKSFFRSKFIALFNCPIEFEKRYLRKTLTLNFHCKHDNCRRYKVTGKVDTDDIVLKIFAVARNPQTNPDVSCIHLADENGVIPISIDCRGPERDKAKQNIQGKTAERFVDEIDLEIQRNLKLDALRNAGNSSNFMSVEAARKLKQEQMGKQDKHKNPWISLKLLCADKEELTSQYVQKQCEYPLNVAMNSDKQLKVLNDARKTGVLIARVDATGGCVKKTDPDQQRIYLYSTVLPLRPVGERFNDQSVTETPVCEMISETHTAVAVHNWQYDFRKRIEKKFPRYRLENIFDRFITDHSYALMFGINDAWNSMRDISEYLDYTFELVQGHTKRKPTVSLIHNCSAHVVKNMSSDVKSHYSKSIFANQQKYNRKLLNMLGLMFSIEDWDQLLEYWRSMCILFLCQKFRNEIKAALESIQTFATIDQVISDTIEATETIVGIKSEGSKETGITPEESTTIYRRSPYFQKFNQILEETTEMIQLLPESDEQLPPNIYYSVEMAKTFTLKYATYAPMWTGLLWKYSTEPLTKPPHNNDNESYFGGMKKDKDEVRTEIGDRPLRIDRFIKRNLQYIEAKLDRYIRRVPKRHVSRIKPYKKRSESRSPHQTPKQRKKKFTKSQMPDVNVTPSEMEELWYKRLKRTPQSNFNKKRLRSLETTPTEQSTQLKVKSKKKNVNSDKKTTTPKTTKTLKNPQTSVVRALSAAFNDVKRLPIITEESHNEEFFEVKPIKLQEKYNSAVTDEDEDGAVKTPELQIDESESLVPKSPVVIDAEKHLQKISSPKKYVKIIEKQNIEVTKNLTTPYLNGLMPSIKYYNGNPCPHINYVVTQYLNIEGTKINVKFSDFLCLENNAKLDTSNWLSDVVIDALFTLKVKQTNNSSYIFVDTISVKLIMAEILGRELPILHSKITQTSVLIMPYSEGNHWYLILADMKTAKFTVINPYFPNSLSKRNDLLQKFKKLIDLYDKNHRTYFAVQEWVLCEEAHHLPVQDISKDDYNCGVYIIMYFDILFRSTSKRNLCDFDANKCRILYQTELLKTSRKMQNLCLLCAAGVGEWIRCGYCKRWICSDCHNSIYSTSIAELKHSFFACFLCEQNNILNCT
jgi:hypothetical protein